MASSLFSSIVTNLIHGAQSKKRERKKKELEPIPRINHLPCLGKGEGRGREGEGREVRFDESQLHSSRLTLNWGWVIVLRNRLDILDKWGEGGKGDNPNETHVA